MEYSWKQDYRYVSLMVLWNSDGSAPVSAGQFGSDFAGAKWSEGLIMYGPYDTPVRQEAGLCPGGKAMLRDLFRYSLKEELPGNAFVAACSVNNYLNAARKRVVGLIVVVAVPKKAASSAPGPVRAAPAACSTSLLAGQWRASGPQLSAKGLSIDFANFGAVRPHGANQPALQGRFGIHSAHRNHLSLLPEAIYTNAPGQMIGGKCLIPLVRAPIDSNVSRTAALVDPATDSLRFISDGTGYGGQPGNYRLFAAAATEGLPNMGGRWVRGAAAPEPERICRPADINGQWSRPDGALVTFAGVGSYRDGGNASMQRHPGFWLQSQMKFTGVRHVRGCTYSAKCFTTKRTYVDGKPNYSILEDTCEITVDPAGKKMRTTGSHGSYVRGNIPAPPQPRTIKRADVLKRPDMSLVNYPDRAAKAGIGGKVDITLTVGTDGRATDCVVTSPPLGAGLDEASCQIWMRQARFSPELVDGEPAESKVRTSVVWRAPSD
ncbi:energy transducer TonB [Sphingomonas canadensis]|uniref:Energy transducer TonB n=1 Tax=Sphingomonas canadensis TaxID=1219257 RepID=A0ABW3H934_9SPHN|nr:energy transducer TonB [Sphingomonas canadensis]MCW3837033.1 energy transducer TonB [Sphingomonas canadensis]